jgi:hypothetical protein
LQQVQDAVGGVGPQVRASKSRALEAHPVILVTWEAEIGRIAV